MNPLNFYQDVPVVKTKEPKVSSHIYLGRIKHLKDVQERKVELLASEIEQLKYKNEVLEIQVSLKILKDVSSQEQRTVPVGVNSNTLMNLKSLTKNTLEYILGHDENDRLITQNISNEPHLLIAGKTGSGKSVTLFNILVSICHNNTPETLNISLIDPKILSFGDKRIIDSSFLREKPSVGDNEQAEKILSNAYNQMMKRYQVMVKEGVKDYRDINLPAHVIFIDEVFELLEGSNAKSILGYITRIASLGRAGGVHLVMATQSPRAKTLSGTLKANLEFIGHRMSNPIESKLIELPKANELLGKGDGLRVIGSEVVRFQATYIDIDKDETYLFFNPKHGKNKIDPIHTQNRPNTEDPKHYNIEVTELKKEIIKTVGEDSKIKPKSNFINTSKRAELAKWSQAINELKADEIIAYEKGKGYFIAVDYHTAISIISGE